MFSDHHTPFLSNSSIFSRNKRNVQKRVLFTLFSFILLLIHYLFVSSQATLSMWGNSFLYFDTISNVQFFYLFLSLGNFSILLSAILKYITSSNHQKKVFLFGIFLYWVGLYGYFDFLLFEPFVVIYALIVMIFYLNFTPLLMPDYDGYILIAERTFFHTNTKLMLANLVETGFIDIVFIILFLIAFNMLKNLFNDQDRLIGENSSANIEFLAKEGMKITLDTPLMKFLFFVLSIAYILLMLMLRIQLPLLVFVTFILTIYLPLKHRELFSSVSITIGRRKINFIRLYYISYVGISMLYALLDNGDVFIIIRVLLLIGFSILILKGINSFKDKEMISINMKNYFLINLTTVGNFLLLNSIFLYAGFWMGGDRENETLFFNLVYYLVILRYGKAFLESILRPDSLHYLTKRFLLLLPLVTGVTMIVYGMMSITGDPVTTMLLSINQRCNNRFFTDDPAACIEQVTSSLRHAYGLDVSPIFQWFNWFIHFILGDLGKEITMGNALISETIPQKIIPSIEISLIPLVFAIAIALYLGTKSAAFVGTIKDKVTLLYTSLGVAIPSWIFAIFMITIFSSYSFNIKLLPPRGTKHLVGTITFYDYEYIGWFFKGFFLDVFDFQLIAVKLSQFFSWERYDFFFHYLTPFLAVCVFNSALIIRLLRANILEVIQKDYILSARAYGFSKREIYYKYAFRNSLIPVITFIGILIGGVISTLPVLEVAFNWDGMAQYMIQAMNPMVNDYFVMMAVTTMSGIILVASNLIVDIAYGIIDPRIRYN